MNVHLNPFFIWNSYYFQTELPALLGLENKRPCHFLINPILHKFSFSVQVYFNLQQHGENGNMFSPCLLRYFYLVCSCEVRSLWVRQVIYDVETNWCTSFKPEKTICNALINTNSLLWSSDKYISEINLSHLNTTGCVIIKL